MTREEHLYRECIQYIDTLFSSYSIATESSDPARNTNDNIALEVRHACRFVLGESCCGKKDHSEEQLRLGISKRMKAGVDPSTLRKLLGGA